MSLKKSEKSKGIVAFAYNTETIDYESIAQLTIPHASKILGIPYTIITEKQLPCSTNNTRYDIDSKTFITWKNVGRHLAYNMSPYDETIVLDIDYVVTNQNILNIFETDWDYLLQRNSHALTQIWPNKMGPTGLPYVWATVFAFRKTEKSRLFFNLIDRIYQNYAYYRLLFNIQERNFRNDYAFAITDIILNGYSVPKQSIPGSILAVDQVIESMSLTEHFICIKDKAKSYIAPKTDLHIMSKKYLMSDNFRKFINELA